jgi:signal transduction histidine kinase
MSSYPKEIQYLIDNLPYPGEIYNKLGKLITVNSAWRELWKFSKPDLPEISIFSNKLVLKSGLDRELSELFESGGKITTKPVICESGDLTFTKSGVDEIFRFVIYSVADGSGEVNFVVNLIQRATEEIKKTIANQELENVKENSKTILEILENERKRVARELHDEVGQRILLAKLNIELFKKKESDSSNELKESIEHLVEISRQIKNIIHSLHPVVLEKYSLIDSLDLLTHEFNEKTGIKSVVKYFGDPNYDNYKIDLNIYRIFQESLNNISKHSRAENVEIECHFTDRIIVCSIADDGVGFDQNTIVKDKNKIFNYGLISMKERAQLFGGELTIESQIGKGTKIFFQIPIGNR